jgi:hypothetical protein
MLATNLLCRGQEKSTMREPEARIGNPGFDPSPYSNMENSLNRFDAHRGFSETMMVIDPLNDIRWTRFVETHPRASLFHSVPWLQALQRTYRYEPLVYTRCPQGQDLTDGIAFCRVESWLTGRRLVSLPFSDH